MTEGTFDGVVMQGTGGIWQVRTDDGVLFDVSLRGRLKHEAHGSLKLAVGDRVTIGRVADSDSWAIDHIHPRRSKLARRAPAGARGERIIVANLDQVLVVFAAARPEPHPRMLDRFLVIAEANGLAARIIINKIDLAPLVGADLGVMDRDAKIQRGARPFLFCDLKREHNLDAVIAWIEHAVLFGKKPQASADGSTAPLRSHA